MSSLFLDGFFGATDVGSYRNIPRKKDDDLLEFPCFSPYVDIRETFQLVS